jgi:hypothetical protein
MMAKSVIPVSEHLKDDKSCGEWYLVAPFILPCLVGGFVLWLASLWWKEVLTENVRIVLFGVPVIGGAFTFPRVKKSLSKGRVDLVYYTLAAVFSGESVRRQ